MPTCVRSHAKINLGLYIGAPRPDGFHALSTVYQTLEMHDLVTVTARPANATEIRLTSNDDRVPTDHRNTAWKMVDLALSTLGISAAVDIHIDKRLPVQGGLGAGSANAVAALLALEHELAQNPFATPNRAQLAGAPEPALSLPKGPDSETWDTHAADSPKARELPSPGGLLTWPAHRLRLAAQVGSDVPLFLIGGTILGLDRGQDVYPLPDLEPLWCVVASPALGVSTPQAFRDWDALCAREGLTAEASTDKLSELSRAYASAFAGGLGIGSSGVPPTGGDLAGPQESALVRTGITSWIQNDFERVVFSQHPSLAEIKRLLATDHPSEAARSSSCLVAMLSGSGSALFGLYLTRGNAEAALARLARFKDVDVRCTLTRTLPRRAYWSQMLQPNEG